MRGSDTLIDVTIFKNVRGDRANSPLEKAFRIDGFFVWTRNSAIEDKESNKSNTFV